MSDKIVLLKSPGLAVAVWEEAAVKLAADGAALPPSAAAFVAKLHPLPDAKVGQWVPASAPVYKHLGEPAIDRLIGQLLLIRRRKNAKDLTPLEWANYIHAVEMAAADWAASPTYQEFVDIHHTAMTDHAGHAWGAHTMQGHDGRNFLAWHREYLARFEARLRIVNPTVTIPYWDWINDRAIPAPLATPKPEWGITRGVFNANLLPTAQQMAVVMNTGVNPASFRTFQRALEGPHGAVHVAVGGTMGGTRSPADPLFWLHHAMVDRLWALWQADNPGVAYDPPNGEEVLQPPPIMARKVKAVRRTVGLRYVYV